MKALGIEGTLNTLLNRLDGGGRVFYTRFGDGDIFNAAGVDARNHHASPKLQAEMLEAINIKDPNYLKGLAVNFPFEEGMRDGLFAPFKYDNKLQDMAESLITTGETEFLSYILFHYLIVFKPTVFDGFINEYVKPKRKMFIGARPKKDMELIFGPITHYVNTPKKDAYYRMDEWWPEVLENIDDCELCIPTAGSATKVINKNLWNMNKNIHSFDIGSLCDMFEEIPTRTWLRLKGEEIRKRYISIPEKEGARDEGDSALFSTQPSIEPPHINTDNPKININVPFQPGNLGKAYNDIMEKASYDEWVLFLDHDAMLLRTDWYDLLLGIIKEHGEKAGWITCVTNEIWCDDQLCIDSPRDKDGKSLMDMGEHCEYSNMRVENYGDSSVPFNKESFKPLGNVFSGLMILTNKKAWEDAGGFEEKDRIVSHQFLGKPIRFRCDKFLGVDNDYFIKLVDAGYEPRVVPGLYAYHLRSNKSLLKVKKKKKGKGYALLKESNKNDGHKKSVKNGVKDISRKKPKAQSISVCIMTRASTLEDPELNLKRCLDSVKSIADEIIVLNTRTDDDPPDGFDEICQDYGCKIYHRPWTNHFSESRNEAIKHCTKDWTMLIDTDEELQARQGDLSFFKEFVSYVPDNVRSIKFTLINMLNGNRGAQFNPPKMFRHGTIKYENSVHNVPVFFGPAIYCDVIEYVHYGYDMSDKQKELKFKRTSSLLHERLKKDPTDYECYFYLSQIYGNCNKLTEQLKYAEEYLKHRFDLKHIKFDMSIFYSSVRAYIQIGKFDKAKEWLELGLKDMPNDLDLLLTATEFGIMEKDRPFILKSASAFVASYSAWEGLQNQGKNSHFVHSYIPEAYAFCQLHVAHIKLSEGRAAYESVIKTLPQTNDDFHKKMDVDIQRILIALDLKPMVEAIGKEQLQKVA